MVSSLVQDVRFAESALDEARKSGRVYVRLVESPWFSGDANAAEMLDRDPDLVRVRPALADAFDRVLGPLNLPTNIVLFPLPERGYGIRIFETEFQLDTLHRMPEPAEYLMKRTAAVTAASDALSAARHRRVSTHETIQAIYGALWLARGAELPGDFREDVDRVITRAEKMLEDN